MKSILILILYIISIESNCQLKNVIDYQLGFTNRLGLSTNISLGRLHKNLISTKLNFGFVKEGFHNSLFSSYYENGLYSYTISDEIQPRSYIKNTLIYFGGSAGINAFELFKIKRHNLFLESGLFLKHYEKSRMEVLLDNNNSPFLRSFSEKNRSEISMNYSLEYEYLFKRGLSIGNIFSIIPYDGGNSLTNSISITKYF